MTESERLTFITENYPQNSLDEIAHSLGWTSAAPIRARLKQLGIPMRRRGANRTTRHTILSNIHHEILEGWLLSDGHLHLSTVTPSFQLSLVKKEAIEYTKNALPFDWDKTSEFGRKPHHIKGILVKSLQPLFRIRSHTDLALLPYYNRWYKDGKKQLPSDFQLTPRIVRFCIFGDGTRNSSGSEALTLCLESLDNNDKQRLVALFAEQGFEFSINARDQLTISGIEKLCKLLDWLGEPELPCFAYKFIRPMYAVSGGSGRIVATKTAEMQGMVRVSK